MLSKDQIKAIKKIINPKSFNPLLAKLHYRKEKNVFVCTNTFILLEIPSREKFNFDFSIEYEDLKKINDLIWIDIIENKAQIADLKTWVYEIEIQKNEEFPNYDHIINTEKTEIDCFHMSWQYKIFFDLCSMFFVEEIEIRKEIFFWQKYWMKIICKMPLF